MNFEVKLRIVFFSNDINKNSNNKLINIFCYKKVKWKK